MQFGFGFFEDLECVPPLLFLILISGLTSAMAMPSSRWLLPNQLQEPYYQISRNQVTFYLPLYR